MNEMAWSADAVTNLVERTQDAPRAKIYGRQQWTDIIIWLIERDWSEMEIETILRSQYMRWAEDHSGGEASVRGFKCFYETSDCTGYFDPKTIDKMVDEMFPPADKAEHKKREAVRNARVESEHMLWLRRLQLHGRL